MAVFDKKNKKSFSFVEGDLEEKSASNLGEFTAAAKGGSKKIKTSKGRPAISQADKKSEKILIYVSPEQKRTITERAAKNGLSVSQYINIKIFGIDGD